jgi:hypothetical protein
MIMILYSSIDGIHRLTRFTSLAAAKEYAHKWIGKSPCLSPYYAVSDDGIGKIMVTGCTLSELFPDGY